MASYIKFFIAGCSALFLAACQVVPAPQSGTAYLVRHAEKVTSDEAMVVADPRDPPLTEAGEARAETLADLLSNKGITAIYSSDYTRTRDTAEPLAATLGLDVQLYDPSDLPALANSDRACRRSLQHNAATRRSTRRQWRHTNCREERI